MRSSLEYCEEAVELREDAARAWFASRRLRLLRRAADLEATGRAAENVERLRRIAKWDADRAAAAAEARLPTPAAKPAGVA